LFNELDEYSRETIFVSVVNRDKQTFINNRRHYHTVTMSEGEWKPAKKYYSEPKFYKSPKLKDVDLPDDATNIPHPAHTKFDHYYSNEEVLDIWAKPLDSKDYLPTKLELEQLRKDPSPDKFRAYVLFGAHAPCNAYILNMKIDKCDDPSMYI
jgi:hypothetical protein